MTKQEAKEIVITAGKRLVESGLIARTWGNVSCRISESHFVITPSGRDYMTLTPEEIVEVAIADLSFLGDIKPSSEKGVHAEVYQLHPNVNFIIHTHQEQASYISVLPFDSIQVPSKYSLLKGEVICADYGLPGTKKLRRNVSHALMKASGKAIIMKHHGALCYGENYEEAFQVALELEEACKHYIFEQYLNLGGLASSNQLKIGCFGLSRLIKKIITPPNNNLPAPLESKRIENGFAITIDGIDYTIPFSQFDALPILDPAIIQELHIHNKIYIKHMHINYILHATSPGIICVSCAGIKLRPLLDDFTQIAGTSIHTTEENAGDVSSKLKNSSLVLLKEKGALCCGSTMEDVHAIKLVAEKNSNALITAALFDTENYINPLESKLMRLVYLKKYSKQVDKK